MDDIDYSVFTESAKCEIHDCNASSITDENAGVNFASELSRNLYEAGKTNAVVIGHVDSANPNGHRSLSGSDYRHGGRRVYHNGQPLFFTRREGRITAADINRFLRIKLEQGDRYDGNSQRLE